MKKFVRFLTIVFFISHSAFLTVFAEEKPYVVLDENLQQLKDDFNAKVGTVRLLFILGPTCGICLRGMADLNDEFLAEYQSDPRLHTYGVHVPVLRAEEEHIIDSLPLMQGPRIYHYWDPIGTIGQLYSGVLETEAFAWDVWLVYGPEAVWEGETPPTPDYWEHQLPGAFGRDKYLDKKRFAAEVIKRVNELDTDNFDITDVASDESPLADGVIIRWVGQGYGRAIKDYREGQGGMEAIKAIQSREFRGELIIGDSTHELLLLEERPNKIEKHVPEADYMLRYDGERAVERHGHLPQDGVPLTVEAHLMGFFDFDTPLIDWNKKGHKFSMDGAEKHGTSFSWRLVQTDPTGLKWTYLINNRTGMMERMRAFDEDGALMVSVHYSDFREVDGTPIAHSREYKSSEGDTYAIERFDSVKITKSEADAE